MQNFSNFSHLIFCHNTKSFDFDYSQNTMSLYTKLHVHFSVSQHYCCHVTEASLKSLQSTISDEHFNILLSNEIAHTMSKVPLRFIIKC